MSIRRKYDPERKLNLISKAYCDSCGREFSNEIREGDKIYCKGCGAVICKNCQEKHHKKYKKDGLSWDAKYCPKCGKHRRSGILCDVYCAYQ